MWTPKENHPTVETFTQAFQNDLEKEKQILKLSKKEKDALKTLFQREDIIITKADKRSAVVIIDVDAFVKEASQRLDSITFCKKLRSDTTELHRTKVNTCNKEPKALCVLDKKNS